MAKASASKSKSSGNEAPSYPIESVNNALKLLTLLQDRPSIGVTEAAQILAVAPSTAHRLFQMLRYHELVDQDTTSRSYHPGPALIHLGMSILRRFDLRTIARPHLAELAEATQETVHLSILEGAKILVIESIESTQVVRVGTRLGMTFPAHDSTSGRVLLAALSPERLGALYPNPRIPLTRTGSPTSRAQLFKLIEKIRDDGYAVRVGETADDVANMAVPIVDHTGNVRGAIGIAIPITRFKTTQVPHLLELMRTTAERVGAALP
ncbi:MAG: IclR family transcriptional regulator [Myxococcota bacterium]